MQERILQPARKSHALHKSPANRPFSKNVSPFLPSHRNAKESLIMGTMGRPCALNDAQRREVCALIATGCGFRTAADYVGCSPSTIRREALRNPEFHEQ